MKQTEIPISFVIRLAKNGSVQGIAQHNLVQVSADDGTTIAAKENAVAVNSSDFPTLLNPIIAQLQAERDAALKSLSDERDAAAKSLADAASQAQSVKIQAQAVKANVKLTPDQRIAAYELALGIAKTNRQLAAEFFQGLAPDVQQQFAAVFQAVSAIPKDEDALKAIEAVTVPDSLAADKAALIAILSGQPSAPNPTVTPA